MTAEQAPGLYILLISVHGLIRGHDLELGRDADTGGQTKYVVEFARALAEHEAVERVDLLTRQVLDSRVDSSYGEPLEAIAPGAHIVRLPCGPRRYLRKEVLWPHLDSFADNALQHLRRVGRVPDVIHSHYADAGYVGAHLAGLLGVPLIHTGHSLGRVKRQRLMAQGVRESTIESQYNMNQRIEAEEIALDSAALVIASTHQEVEKQYSLYDDYQPSRMKVIPPGVDLSRFHPPKRVEPAPPIRGEVLRFLHYPRRPLILALSRPDERKNIRILVQAFAENPRLRHMANLLVVAGNRDDIEAMDRGPRSVMMELLLLIDRYDLYGSIAYPKHHEAADVADLYRIAAKGNGVFVNPALTEPFGLTLIEAAASGLPIVATEDGGPKDIIANCKNGLLIDPLDADHMGEILVEVLSDKTQWRRWSRNGLRGVHRHYSWPGHVQKYLRDVRRLIRKKPRARFMAISKSRLPTIKRLLVCDIDNTLTGDNEGLKELLHLLGGNEQHVGFGVATGRNINSTLRVLREYGIPVPDVLISAVGSEIYYGHRMVLDSAWCRQIDYRWNPDALRKAMRGMKGVRLQPKDDQRGYKVSYYLDPDKAPTLREIRQHLRHLDLHANLIYSHQAFLDLLPIRASKGLALRHLGVRWGIAPQCILVAGDSGNDEEMLVGNTLGVVVGNYSEELERLQGKPRIYFAKSHHARGIIEGIEFYDFFRNIRIPEEEETVQ